MSLDNSCSFIGRMAAPPDSLGTTGIKFRLGTDSWNGQTKQKETVWVPFVAWGKDADLIKRFGTVGRQLAIEANYKPREYEVPGPNGAMQKRLDPQFVVREVKLLAESSKQQQQGQFTSNQGADWQEPDAPPPDPGYRW